MSAKDQNLTVNRFVQLTSDLPTIAGMRTSGNPASLPSFLFRVLENTAMRGNDIHDRGGQEKYNPDHPIDDCGDGFLPPDEEPSEYQVRLLFQALTDDADSPLWLYSSGISALASLLTKPGVLTYLPGADPGGASGTFVWSSYGISDELTVLATQFSLDRSDNSVSLGSSSSTLFGGSAGEAAEFDGQTYLVTIVQTDVFILIDPFGSGAATEVTATGDQAIFRSPWLRVFNEQLVCPLEPDTLHVKGPGSAGWSTIAMPAGTTAHQFLASSVAYWEEQDGLFFSGTAVGGGYAIFKLDLLGVITQVVELGVGAPGTYQPLAVHNQVLWIGYESSLFYLNPSLQLVSFDTAFFSAGAIRQLISHRGRLWAVLDAGDLSEVQASKFPHSLASWKRISLLPYAFGFGVEHPIY